MPTIGAEIRHMLYSYGLKLGAKELMHGEFNHALRHLIIPVWYWRAVEFHLVQTEGAFRRTDTILDIGSPKLLSIYLAKSLGAEVYATDIDGYFMSEYTTLRQLEGLSPERFHVQVEDGRHLSFADNTFDKVFSVSVIEHIPDTGDSDCVQEIARVLKPGGRCVITVPFGPESKTIYTQAGEIYRADATFKAMTDPVFFQRRYSESDLFDRLITPSGLRLTKLRYVGERVLVNKPREVFEYIPLPATIMLGPVQAVLSRLFHTEPVADWRQIKKPLCAMLVLEKPV